MAKVKFTNTTALDPNRVAQIALALDGQLGAVRGSIMDAATHSEAGKALVEEGGSAREATMLALAILAESGSWTQGEVEAACKQVVDASNAQKTKAAIASFLAECKKAAHPMVRDQIVAWRKISHKAWDDEAAQRKLDPAWFSPIAKAFKRKYHAFVMPMKYLEEGGKLETVNDFIAYAKTRDPDLDADKIFKRMEKIRKDLADFYVDFPDENISHCHDELGKITKEDLLAAQLRKKIAQEEANPEFHTPAPATTPSPALSDVPAVSHTSRAPAFTSEVTIATVVAIKPAPAVSVDPVAAELDGIDGLLDDNIAQAA